MCHMHGLRGFDICYVVKETCFVVWKRWKIFLCIVGIKQIEVIEYLASQRGVRNYTPVFVHNHCMWTQDLKPTEVVLLLEKRVSCFPPGWYSLGPSLTAHPRAVIVQLIYNQALPEYWDHISRITLHLSWYPVCGWVSYKVRTTEVAAQLQTVKLGFKLG